VKFEYPRTRFASEDIGVICCKVMSEANEVIQEVIKMEPDLFALAIELHDVKQTASTGLEKLRDMGINIDRAHEAMIEKNAIRHYYGVSP